MIEVLEEIGVHIVGGEEQIRGHCPVHLLRTGREDAHPSWYMNATTGAWICFSCQARGSLRSLVDELGYDQQILGKIPFQMMKARVQAVADAAGEEVDYVEPEASEFVSEYGFDKHPFPPKSMRLLRDIDKASCQLHNVRWDAEGKCFLIPVYTFSGELIGWQEKSHGYFNNVPKEMKKRFSLFGYQALSGYDDIIVVESPLDVVRLSRHGVHGGVAVFGAFVSKQQVAALVAALPRKKSIILAFDADAAGREADKLVTAMLKKYGVRAKHFVYPGSAKTYGKDPGDLEVDHLLQGVARASFLSRPVAR
jgi:5S rRNA maturation endonuclease (ribonuclease M5)